MAKGSTRRGVRNGLGALAGMIAVSVIAGVVVAVGVTPAVALTGTAVRGGLGLFENLPSDLAVAPLQQRTTMYAVTGAQGTTPVKIAEFFDQNRRSIPWSDVTPAVKDATLAAEDVRYYQHGAIDPLGILRAAVADASGRPVQGASTIAQQYVKNVCVQQAEKLSTQAAVTAAYDQCIAPDIARKLQEARYAIGLEKKYTKDQILLGYLNIAGFGGNIYGIQAAAQYYFGVDAKQLSIAQAASLLAILNNPSRLELDIKANIPANTTRRAYILGQELKYRMIDRAQWQTAMNTPVVPKITPASSGCNQAGVAGYFCSYVVSQIEQNPVFGATPAQRYNNLYSDGWKIYTTLNLDLEQKAQQVMNTYAPMHLPAFNIGGAAVSVGVGTGQVLTMVQNKKYNNSGGAASLGPDYTAVNFNVDQVNGGAGGLQPGSTYKLFTLVDWLEHGHTLNEIINGTQGTFPASSFTICGQPDTGAPWHVLDDQGAADAGPTTVMHATAQSINGAFARMGQRLDLCDIRNVAKAFDVHTANGSPLNDYPASILGTNYVSPLTMATAYAAMGDGGRVCTPVAITRIVDPKGRNVPVPTTSCTQAAPAPIVTAVDTALRTVFKPGGTGAGDLTPDGVYEVGKTGTTDHNANTWTIGTSNKVATAVWVGNISGYTNLRTVYSTPYCPVDGTTQAALERHCLWRGIQTAENQYYGGSSQPFGTPAAQYTGVTDRVPNVIGLSPTAAESALTQAHYAWTIGSATAAPQPAGTVAATSPASGTALPQGSNVTIRLSTGAGSVTTPPGTTPGATPTPTPSPTRPVSGAPVKPGKSGKNKTG